MTDTTLAVYPGYVAFAEFFDAIAERAPIYGEQPGSHNSFRRALMKSLSPFTAYERAVAENLVAIEWEIIQKRHMIDAQIRHALECVLTDIALKHARAQHERDQDARWDAFIADGGEEDDWKDTPFDQEGAQRAAEELARNALSRDDTIARGARQAFDSLGVDAVRLMGDAHLKQPEKLRRLDDDLRNLERRRRDVKKDYDTLQSLRPVTPGMLK